MRTSDTPIRTAKTSTVFAAAAPAATPTGGRPGERLRRYLSCLRPQEILVLQGPPLLGAAFAIRHPAMENIGPLAILTVANVCLMAHVFILNDWSGLTADLADPNKAAGVFTARGASRK